MNPAAKATAAAAGATKRAAAPAAEGLAAAGADKSARELLRALWRGLSKPQRAAMDACADGGLRHIRAGWVGVRLGGLGTAVHSTAAVRALARKDLIRISGPNARITEFGKEVFGSVGEPVSWESLR